MPNFSGIFGSDPQTTGHRSLCALLICTLGESQECGKSDSRSARKLALRIYESHDFESEVQMFYEAFALDHFEAEYLGEKGRDDEGLRE